ncbi:hypothetical protein BGL_2c26530 [Burkholderia plantarii]|uniref:Lipoprotein n=1 Tax=Burkholderia plantarii TaxID=41899 RepID=A0A0B6RZA8_BURPL|nr:hypothetical protein BGL_2c26530 [Burkholderia plantarii]
MRNDTKKSRPGSLLRSAVLVSTLQLATLLAACTSVYVDTATKEVPVADMKPVTQPKPVQLVFEFQSKGVPNPRATDLLKETVTKEVTETRLFASVSTDPTPGIAMLNVTLNNIPLTDGAAAKGFVTGLTFGLAGNTVTDGYICTVSYLPAGQSTPIVKTARHAIHATIGVANAPATARKSASIDEAVNTMTREVLSNALKDLSDDPAFN